MTPRNVLWAGGAAFTLTLAVAVGAPAVAVQGDYEFAVTAIPVKLTTRLSSEHNKAGDTFTFDTTSSVLVDALFLPAATHGRGVVLAARAAHGAVAGRLLLAAQSLDLPDGTQLAVALEQGRFDLPLPPDARRSAGSGKIVYERGTPFVVVAPPPPSPEP